MKGIDLSHHNGEVDFSKLKSQGIDFVILRAGYGRYTKQKDSRFEENYLEAKKNGLHVGAYWYSYAKDAVEALAEAKTCEQVLYGKQFDLPIFIDIEEKISQSKAVDIADAFCSYMKSKGFYPGVYASKSYLETYMQGVSQRYPVWVAQWASKCNYNGCYCIWQNSDKGRLDGINGYVDTDVLLEDDLPMYIINNAFNGYVPEVPDKTKLLVIYLGGEKIFEKLL